MRASPQAGALGDDGDESCMVVALILDAFLEYGQSVASSRRTTRDRRARKVATLGDFAGGTARVERFDRLEALIERGFAALAQDVAETKAEVTIVQTDASSTPSTTRRSRRAASMSGAAMSASDSPATGMAASR